ncbi:MAG: hypothetical protein Q7T11_06370 [Deltaproteobacteria bacterium]|nr:hypothetical protein [Deltaproteobacteria bacterium]
MAEQSNVVMQIPMRVELRMPRQTPLKMKFAGAKERSGKGKRHQGLQGIPEKKGPMIVRLKGDWQQQWWSVLRMKKPENHCSKRDDLAQKELHRGGKCILSMKEGRQVLRVCWEVSRAVNDPHRHRRMTIQARLTPVLQASPGVLVSRVRDLSIRVHISERRKEG